MTESDGMFKNSSITKQQLIKSVSLLSSLFDKLTDELLIEILICLPLKPASLCKCVSSRFRSLISTSYFIRCYKNHHNQNHHPFNNPFALYYQSKPNYDNMIQPSTMGIDLIFESPIFESPCFNLSFIAHNEDLEQHSLQYLASNNGLLLCCVALSRPVVYFVCNPLTKQYVALPLPPSNVIADYIGFISKPRHDYDDRRDTSFKVVRIEAVWSESEGHLSRTLKFEIFCSLLGRWTEEYFNSSSSSSSNPELFYCKAYGHHSAVVCNGLLHWDTLSTCGIFIYDPYNGECRTIGLPDEVSRPVWAFKHFLGESNSLLRYAHISLVDSSYQVLELKDNGNGGEWLLVHKVRFDEMESMIPNINNDSINFLLPHPLNQDIVFFWCESSNKVLEYNMRIKVLKLPCFIRHVKMITPLYPMFFPFVLPSWPTAVPRLEQHDLS
ncbi:putative F-box protein At3g23970 [Rutidosis leptorrhynchoides]|uniref:putative F-box protein At3g23970 n=1 Tax=Rutidosis leptorrhynchoides TaxID=125765 RepID=UPI003A996FAA